MTAGHSSIQPSRPPGRPARVRALATLIAACALAVTTPAAAQAQRSTLDTVKGRGQLVCGVIGTFFGFSAPDSQGRMRGIDADACRAVSAAVLGDGEKVRFVNLTAQQRFPALQSGEVDVLYAIATWTLTRDSKLGMTFASINYYDGAGFMVRKSLNVKSARELDGASICIQSGGTGEAVVADWARRNRIQYKPVLIADAEENRRAFLAGRCDAYQSDTVVLSVFMRNQGPKAAEFMILPEVLSNEPLGGAVRKGDDRWFDIVRWTHHALVAAEMLGITQDNVESMLKSESPEIRRLLGLEGDIGASMGLDNRWAYNAIKAVGNYGEIWTRNIGPTGLQRGANRTWKDGGLHYAPPIR
jgi:general L-amino acid transport system substrate-binding protein